METELIVEALGGTKVLRRAVRTSGDLTRLVREGLPADSLNAFAEKLSLAQGTLSAKAGIAGRTYTRRLSEGSRLTAGESDRIVRMARLYAHAVKMIGDERKAIAWLSTPNRALAGEKPLDLLDTDIGSREVEDVLGRIAYGVYS